MILVVFCKNDTKHRHAYDGRDTHVFAGYLKIQVDDLTRIGINPGYLNTLTAVQNMF